MGKKRRLTKSAVRSLARNPARVCEVLWPDGRTYRAVIAKYWRGRYTHLKFIGGDSPPMYRATARIAKLPVEANVLDVIRDPAWRQESNLAVARHCGVSERKVRDLREREGLKPTHVRRGDGVLVDVRNIGRKKKPPRKPDPETVARATAFVRDPAWRGATSSAVAAAANCRASLIDGLRRREGLPLNRVRRPWDRIPESVRQRIAKRYKLIADDYQAGWTVTELTRKYRASFSTVYSALKHHRVPLRGRSD